MNQTLIAKRAALTAMYYRAKESEDATRAGLLAMEYNAAYAAWLDEVAADEERAERNGFRASVGF